MDQDWQDIATAPEDEHVFLKREGEWEDARGRLVKETWLMVAMPEVWHGEARLHPLGPPTHWRWGAEQGQAMGAALAFAEQNPAANDALPVAANEEEALAIQGAAYAEMLAGLAERYARHVLEGLILAAPPFLPPPTVDQCIAFRLDPSDPEGMEMHALTEYGERVLRQYGEIASAELAQQAADAAEARKEEVAEPAAAGAA